MYTVDELSTQPRDRQGRALHKMIRLFTFIAAAELPYLMGNEFGHPDGSTFRLRVTGGAINMPQTVELAENSLLRYPAPQ